MKTDCVSINHNWFNAANVAHVWDHLQDQLELVEKSTEDVRDTPGWNEQCQVSDWSLINACTWH